MMTLNNETLQKIRKNAMHTQESMADLMKMESSTYSRLENGKIKLKMEHIPKIAKAVGKSEEDILSQLRDCTVSTTNGDNAQNSQNLVINVPEKELLKQLLAEKERNLVSKDEVIKTQAMTINLLQAEIERFRKK